jgi:cell division protein FtsB
MARERKKQDPVRTSRKHLAPQAEGRKGFRLRLPYIMLLVLLVLFAVKFIQKTQEIRGLEAQKAALAYQNQQLQHDNEHVQQSIRYYHSPQYVEEEARAVFGYTRSGDVAIMSQPRHPPILTVGPAPRPVAPAKPTWKQWWQAFFH